MIYPSAYNCPDDSYWTFDIWQRLAADFQAGSGGRLIIPGIGGGYCTFAEIARRIDKARDLGVAGQALFSYRSLFEKDGQAQELWKYHFGKSWDEFVVPGAPVFDFIFTVCDSAAGEACPVWIGHPMTAHWGVEDPAAVDGSDADIQRAFAQAARFLKNRIMAFINLPLASIDRMALESHLKQIGALEGSTTPQDRSA